MKFRNYICHAILNAVLQMWLVNGGLQSGQRFPIEGSALIGWNPCLENGDLHSMQPFAIVISSDWLKMIHFRDKLIGFCLLLQKCDSSELPLRRNLNEIWREKKKRHGDSCGRPWVLASFYVDGSRDKVDRILFSLQATTSWWLTLSWCSASTSVSTGRLRGCLSVPQSFW